MRHSRGIESCRSLKQESITPVLSRNWRRNHADLWLSRFRKCSKKDLVLGNKLKQCAWNLPSVSSRPMMNGGDVQVLEQVAEAVRSAGS